MQATLDDFQKLVTSEQKSRKFLDASVKTLSVSNISECMCVVVL